MKLRPLLVVAAFCAAPAVPAAPVAVSAQESATPSMEAVAFLAGCWRQPGDSGLREYYAPPARNMTTGLSQFRRNGAVVDWEFHRIDAGPDGPVLTPHPRGVASVPFQPRAVEDGRIVWENLEHDFPQRIIYTRVADTLTARIEGGTGPEARGMEWRMVRASCDAP